MRRFVPVGFGGRLWGLGAALLTGLVPGALWGQWAACGSGQCITSGNVGIGTTSPSGLLDVEGGEAVFHRDDWGNPTLVLRGQKAGAPYYWGEYAIVADYIGLAFNNTQTGVTMLQLGAGGGTSANVLIAPSGGNVGIGTTYPQYPLSVNGTVQAKEVLVNTGWSDYVFGPGYRLAPLSEVADYISANGHLPEIPSAKEVKEKGVSLGEMQSKLLAKIEELTLHMIEAEKENAELRARIARLEAK